MLRRDAPERETAVATNSSAITIVTPTRCSCAGKASHSSPTSPIMGFEFEIFASGEYSRMLEREWAEDVS